MAHIVTKGLKIECKALETTVMIRGIPLCQKAANELRKETADETRAQAIAMLINLGLKSEEENGFNEVLRLPQREITLRDGKVIQTDTIKIKFNLLQGKLNLFKALVANGKNFKQVKVHDAIPSDLIPEKRELDDLASDYRKKFPGCKTRTMCRFGTVYVAIKKAGETTFKKIAKKTLLEDLCIVSSDTDSSDDEEYEDSPKRKGFTKRRRK